MRDKGKRGILTHQFQPLAIDASKSPVIMHQRLAVEERKKNSVMPEVDA